MRQGRVWWCAPFAAADSGDSGTAHEPGDLVTADIVASTAGSFPQLAGAVDPVEYARNRRLRLSSLDRLEPGGYGPRAVRPNVFSVVGNSWVGFND